MNTAEPKVRTEELWRQTSTLFLSNILLSHGSVSIGTQPWKIPAAFNAFMKGRLMKASEKMLLQIQALAHPARLWIVAQLSDGRRAYVSELAREAQISRPLMKMHLRKLEAAELVVSEFETARSGKAANFYEIVPFVLAIDPQSIAQAGPFPTPGALHSTGDSDD